MSSIANAFYFTSEEITELKKMAVPRHVAVIPDGNRRWARNQLTNIPEGHREGADNLIRFIKAAKELGIQTVTFYLFSTENWTRDQTEVQALMWLLEQFLIEQQPVMIEQGIRFHTIGDLAVFPESTKDLIAECKAATSPGSAINLVAALNYGSRNEICRAFNKIMEDCDKGILKKNEITEKIVSSYLDTAPFGDPELLIRSSGEMRVSNFLLWQISYSEIYVVDVFWPDFKPAHLLKAINFFQTRDRRLGGS